MTLQAILSWINERRENTSIDLSVRRWDLSPEEWVQVAQELATCPNLTNLNLNNNNLGGSQKPSIQYITLLVF